MSTQPNRKKQRTSPIKQEIIADTVNSSAVNTEIAFDANKENNNKENVNVVKENHGDDDKSTDDVCSLLHRLHKSKDAPQALPCIRRLQELLADEDDEEANIEKEKANARKVVELQGLPTIIHCIKDYEESIEIVTKAVGCLVQISYHVPEMTKTIVDWNTIGIIMDISITTTDSITLNRGIICLLCNIATEKSTRIHVSTSKIIDFVMETMKKYPDRAHLQKCGCDYFRGIMKVQGKKEELKQKEMLTLLSKTHDNFYNKNDNVQEAATYAIKSCLDCYDQKQYESMNDIWKSFVPSFYSEIN